MCIKLFSWCCNWETQAEKNSPAFEEKVKSTTPDVDENRDMPAIKKITSVTEFKSLLDSAGEKNVVVDFYATWCGPCKKAAPLYKEIAKKYKDSCVAVSVDVDELEEVAAKCGVTAMPTFQVYKTGNKIGEFIGAPKKDQLENLFMKERKK